LGKEGYVEERIKARIEALKQQRDRFITEANQQIAAANGAIGELEALLQPEPEAEKEDECA
jgi:hypothetical protein